MQLKHPTPKAESGLTLPLKTLIARLAQVAVDEHLEAERQRREATAEVLLPPPHPRA